MENKKDLFENSLCRTVDDTTSFSHQLSFLKELRSYIIEEAELVVAKLPQAPYSSVEVKELYTALAKSQAEYLPAFFNRTNPYLDLQYVDLNNLIKATRAALTKNGLAVIFFNELPGDGSTILHVRLLHSSGQWMETRERILPVKNDISSYESTLNSQKRMAYMCLLGIVPENDPGDDDGEIAMIDANKYIAKSPSIKLKEQSKDVIARHELEELERELKDYPDLAEDLLEKLRLRSLADLPSSQYRTTLIRIRKIKDEYANQAR